MPEGNPRRREWTAADHGESEGIAWGAALEKIFDRLNGIEVCAAKATAMTESFEKRMDVFITGHVRPCSDFKEHVAAHEKTADRIWSAVIWIICAAVLAAGSTGLYLWKLSP